MSVEALPGLTDLAEELGVGHSVENGPASPSRGQQITVLATFLVGLAASLHPATEAAGQAVKAVGQGIRVFFPDLLP